MSIITVKKLSAFYENREIFKDLNFTVHENEYLCIIGDNGSGKTTLMKTLLGLNIKHTGEIEYNGFNRNEIGWLPQKNESQRDFPASVFEVVLSGFGGKSFLGLGYNKKLKDKAIKNMEILGISELRNTSFRSLSGGQQQKVLLCRALCAAKKVLLLDEPVTGLDSASQEEMYALIRKLHKSGMAIIMISHDVQRAVKEACHILSLSENGSFFGSDAEYIAYCKGEF